MAEVRALPSAVGAFEAQVIDFSSAFNTIARKNALARKEAAEMLKRAETDLNTVLHDKRVVRPQESKLVTDLRKELQDFYSANKAEIAKGGDKYNELKQKMGYVSGIVNQSMSAKEQQAQIDAYTKTIIEDPVKGQDVGELWKKAIDVQRMRVDDPERAKFRMTNINGVDVGIEQLSINDLDKVKFFDATMLDDDIKTIESETFKTEYYSKKSGQDVTNVFSYKPPLQIYDKVLSRSTASPDMLDFYRKQYEAEEALFANSGATLQQRVDKEWPKLIEFYENAGAATKGAGLGSLKNISQMRDGVEGIDVSNPFEYALFQKLKANLPEYLGKTYDYKTQSNLRAAKSLRLQEQNFYLQKRNLDQAGSLDGLLIKQIKSGKFNSAEASKVLEGLFSQQESVLGNLVPAKYDINDKNKTITVTTHRPLLNIDGTIIKSKDVALQMLGGKPGEVVQLPLGVGWGIRDVKTFSIDPNTPGWETNITSALNLGQDAQQNQTTKKVIGDLRTKTGVDVLKALQQ